MHLYLDRQHFGKPHPKEDDRGVPVDRDGDGHAETTEADLTPRYIAAAKAAFEAAGHTVTLVPTGWYSTRHAWVCEDATRLTAVQRPAAYIACHLNAGGGDYGLLVHDPRSTRGAALAQQVSASLREAFSVAELRRVVVSGDSARWSNAFATIKGIYAGPSWLSGICFEPVFVDHHRPLLTDANLDRIGVALAEGVMAWATPVVAAAALLVAQPEAPLIHDGVPRDAEDARNPLVAPEESDLVVTADGRAREVLAVDAKGVMWRSWPKGRRSHRQTLAAWRDALVGGVVVEASR